MVCGESVMTPALARVGLDYEISSRFPSYDPNSFSSVHPWVRDHGLGPLGGGVTEVRACRRVSINSV